MFLAERHLDVETLLCIVLGKWLEIEHGAVVLLVEFGTRCWVSADDLLLATGSHGAIFANEASTTLNNSESLLAQLELEFDRSLSKLLSDHISELVKFDLTLCQESYNEIIILIGCILVSLMRNDEWLIWTAAILTPQLVFVIFTAIQFEVGSGRLNHHLVILPSIRLNNGSQDGIDFHIFE